MTPSKTGFRQNCLCHPPRYIEGRFKELPATASRKSAPSLGAEIDYVPGLENVPAGYAVPEGRSKLLGATARLC